MAIATRSTAIGAFASRPEAAHAVRELLGAAFGADQVGIVLPDAMNLAANALEPGPLVMVRAGERYPESMEIINRCGGEYMAAY